MEWYSINNISEFDTPQVVIYPERVASNIDHAIAVVGDVALLRPHVKTNKIAEVCTMMMQKGINRFKCATIAEAEMLAMVGAQDILLAYQPVPPKSYRLLALVQKYPATSFSCIVDDTGIAAHLSKLFQQAGRTLNVYIDVNTGMNRTGIADQNARSFIDYLAGLPNLNIVGIHAYDGHIVDADLRQRQALSEVGYNVVKDVARYAENKLNKKLNIVAGGSRTFAAHARREVECSPGTFAFWDAGYHLQYPAEPFEYAALVVTRVISIVSDTLLTTDLGYKSVASENPMPRVYFLNAPEAVPKVHSEEHLTVQVPDTSIYRPGDVWYGVPVHICPTVALYDEAAVVENHSITKFWKVAARVRKLSV